MRIVCNHGYFFFYEDASGEVSKFNTIYGQDLVLCGNYYTFTALKNLPNYVLKGKPYGGVLATKTYKGEPYEIMRKNNLVYNPLTKMITNKLLSGELIEPKKAYNFYVLNGLITPGCYETDLRKILGFTCRVDMKELIYRYTGFNYV